MIETVRRCFAAVDRVSLDALPKLRYAPLNPIMIALSFSGSGFIWFPFAAVVMVGYATRDTVLPAQGLFLACMTGSLFALIAGQILKRIIRRKRPAGIIPGHRVIGIDHRDYSMPSTHSSTSVALAAGLGFHGHPWAGYAMPWAVLVVYSRYYLGVHYPTDLACGALLGALFGMCDWSPLVRALFG